MRALVIVALLALAPTSARAEGGPFGLGLVVGKPTGISGAYHLGDSTAIAAALGLDVLGGKGFYIHGDFLFLLPDLLGGGAVGLRPYLGPGVWISDLGKRANLGARVPFGLSLDFRSAPIEIFAEISVSLRIIRDVNVGIGGALGFRYYF
jgi:hypothetical protein